MTTERRSARDESGRTPNALRRRLSLLAVCAALLAAAPGLAEDDDADHYDRLSLSAESSREVANDWMVARLAVELEDDDPAALADRVNDTMRWALALARGESAATVESGAYRTYPIQREGRIDRWRALQELRIEGSDTDAIVPLVGALQQQLQLKSLDFTLSPERRRDAENELIREALDAFKARAEIVRENFEAASYRLVNASLQTSGSRPPQPVVMRALSRAESVSPPAVESGASTVQVSVHGTIELR